MRTHSTKKAIEIITSSDYLAPSNPLFIRLNMLNLYDIVKYKTYLLGYRAYNSS